MSSVKIVNGDCLEILKKLPDECADSVVTDPPYEIGFMGKGHDSTGIAFNTEMWAECLRVLKPGGHLLSFGASKTYHRMAVAVEDAGFEIRDGIFWCYGSGFPKSLDVSKAIDKAAGALAHEAQRFNVAGQTGKLINPPTKGYVPPAPATPEAQQWQGWGTALKPAVEPIVVARKPLSEKTVAKNVLKHGTGGINIDGTRVDSRGGNENNAHGDYSGKVFGSFAAQYAKPSNPAGRWPANLILGHSTECYLPEESSWECVESCPVANLDKQSGTLKSGKPGTRRKPHQTGSMSGTLNTTGELEKGFGDSGGGSRFFHNFQMESPLIYQAKANKKERPLVDGKGHSTVKPLSLMQNLVRLVTPPGGTVLEPFAGSGTTLEAAVLEGFNAIGIEMTEEYIPLIEQRLERQGMVKKNSVAWETVDD